MRLKHVALTLAAAGSFAAASPSPHRQHFHHHAAKRAPDNVVVVKQFEINGQIVPLQDVCDGLKAGLYALKDGGVSLEDCDSLPSSSGSDNTLKSSATNKYQHSHSDPAPKDYQYAYSLSTEKQTPVATVTPLPTQAVTKGKSTPTSDPASAYTPPSAASSSSAPPASYSSAPVSSYSPKPPTSSSSGGTSGGKGVDREFPDGQIDCSDFPSGYGPIDISWMGLGGWSGIQYPQYSSEGDSIVDIVTAVSGDGCTADAMCSYACPPGYQKSQWPKAQGSTAQSVGGLRCNKDGKLTLTNPSLSKTLCMKGTGEVKVQNKLSKNAAICRTDYPGTESQTVPLDTQPDTTSPLTCPDSKAYYFHEGSPTTAQYYVNNQGVKKEDACRWNSDGSHEGNWAPSYFGVGRDVHGKTWLSIASTIQNNPTDYQPLDYRVEIIGDTSGSCVYDNGQYCGVNGCNKLGCTVELLSGDGTFLLKDQ
ncbi:hypothetical protein MMC22_011819 [Lobaria immixta]|nr:hypothetical protein [Lobaria immixta]